MESGWTSKYDILQDLSVAQGREVPVEIQNTVIKDEKPPDLNYTEETEEEFFENCVSNGDFSTGPDTTLIQQMLNMVREINVTNVEGVTTNTVVDICNNSNNGGSGDGIQIPEIIKKSVETQKKSKQKKNVAVASLIAAYEDSSENKFPETPKLLKPNDFVSDNKTNMQAIQINESLEPCSTHTRKEKEFKTIVSPTLMFQKKSPNTKNTDDLRRNSSPISIKSEVPLEAIKPGSFVPSSHAGKYYKKFVERTAMQAKVKEDIWNQAERQMKEINLKRKQDSKASSNSEELSEEVTLQWCGLCPASSTSSHRRMYCVQSTVYRLTTMMKCITYIIL